MLLQKHYRIIVSCYLFCLLSSVSAQSPPSIAILDLESRGISSSEIASLTDRLRSEMVKTGRITVVERGQMQQILSEQDFQMAGCTSEECAVEVGQLLGVSKMIAGSIGKVGSTFSIDIRTIDVSTGRITNSITRDYKGQIDGLLAQMSILAGDIVDFEAPETASRRRPVAGPGLQEAPKKKGGGLVKWAVIGAVVVGGGGYLAVTMLAAEEDAGLTVGSPPSLPEGP